MISNFRIVNLVVWPPAPLVVEKDGDGAGAAVLDKVGESWLEVIVIGELQCVPPEKGKTFTFKRPMANNTSAQQHQR